MARAVAHFLLLTVVVNVAAARSGVTPIQKVLQMMEEMKTKGIADKKDEAVKFSAFKQFCTDTTRTKTTSIEEAALRIEQLDADIAQGKAEIEELSKAIAELESDVARWATDKKAATDVRQKEEVDYAATHKDYVDTVDACDRAIAVIKSQPESIPQSLLQTHLQRVLQFKRIPVKAKRALMSLLEVEKQDPMLNYDAPEANAYESQSAGILSMIEDLRTRFKGEQTDLEKEEMIAKSNYDTVIQSLTDQTELAEQQLGQKRKRSAEVKEAVASAEGELSEAKRVKAEDEKYLIDLKAMCDQKSADFENRQVLRQQEIEALSKAIEIISSMATPTEIASGTSLAQLRVANARNPKLERVASLLRERASKTGSQVLAMIAQKAESDPFAKVKKMIKDLIVRLMEEANEEADHKAWCDAELATNKQTRMIKSEEVDQLTTEVEKLTATSARLKQEIADLSEEMTEIDKAIAVATSDRQEEKEKNAQVIADAKQCQAAVAEALAVLRDFYAKAAEATAFAQQTPEEDAPVTFDSPYQGMQSESGGVLGMLEVIESDYARLETSTSASEDEAQATFEKFVADSKEDKAVKGAEVDHKASKQQTTESLLVTTKKNLEQTQAQLDAALDYYDKLKPDCVDSGLSYEDRVKRRKEEIESLTDAYKILAGEDLPSLQDMKAEQIGVE